MKTLLEANENRTWSDGKSIVCFLYVLGREPIWKPGECLCSTIGNDDGSEDAPREHATSVLAKSAMDLHARAYDYDIRKANGRTALKPLKF